MTVLQKGLYAHYKGPFYKVLDVATHSETEEPMVVYQALYGDKGMWVRPLSMFTESVSVEVPSDDGAASNGEALSVPRFARVEPQTEVNEIAILNVKAGEQGAFERAFKQAQVIVSGASGYISHSLSRCVEQNNRYLLLINWQTIEDHEHGFRRSAEYQEWRALLHHFYEPFPDVEHYVECALAG